MPAPQLFLMKSNKTVLWEATMGERYTSKLLGVCLVCPGAAVSVIGTKLLPKSKRK